MNEMPKPICKCLKCESVFTIRPIVGQENVKSYGERLERIVCFKCGSGSEWLNIIES